MLGVSTRTSEILTDVLYKEFKGFLPTDNLREFIKVSQIIMGTDSIMGRLEPDEALELAEKCNEAINKLIKEDN